MLRGASSTSLFGKIWKSDGHRSHNAFALTGRFFYLAKKKLRCRRKCRENCRKGVRRLGLCDEKSSIFAT